MDGCGKWDEWMRGESNPMLKILHMARSLLESKVTVKLPAVTYGNKPVPRVDFLRVVYLDDVDVGL